MVYAHYNLPLGNVAIGTAVLLTPMAAAEDAESCEQKCEEKADACLDTCG